MLRNEEIDRLAERIASRLLVHSTECLSYGTVARYKKCTIYFDCDEKENDIFIIRDENNNIIGKFVEENEEYNNRIIDLLEAAAEEIENCYGRETELSEKLRYVVNKHSS